METGAEANSSSMSRDPSGPRPWYKLTHTHAVVYHRYGKRLVEGGLFYTLSYKQQMKGHEISCGTRSNRKASQLLNSH